jgi:anti-sigma-K factor RskA
MRTARLALAAVAVICVATALSADPLICSLPGYKAVPGLGAAVSDNTLAVVWDGEKNQEVRLRSALNGGAPKWVRFAVWDSAGNGAFVQPVKLRTVTSTSAGQP